jgi:hypothetical protein
MRFRTLIILILFLIVTSVTYAQSKKTVYVKSYTKKNGTHVTAHKRSSPNKTKSDNWSSKGNTNPYTGKRGTKKVKR